MKSGFQGNRDESPNVDEAIARLDAEALYNAGEKMKWGTDESEFNRILVSKSYQHLRHVFDEYKKLANKDIEESIKSEFSGDICMGLLSLGRYLKFYKVNKKPHEMAIFGINTFIRINS